MNLRVSVLQRGETKFVGIIHANLQNCTGFRIFFGSTDKFPTPSMPIKYVAFWRMINKNDYLRSPALPI